MKILSLYASLFFAGFTCLLFPFPTSAAENDRPVVNKECNYNQYQECKEREAMQKVQSTLEEWVKLKKITDEEANELLYSFKEENNGRVSKALDALVKRSKITAEEAKDLTRRTGTWTKEKTQSMIEGTKELYSDMLQKSNIATAEHMRKIEERLEALEKKVK